MNNQIDEPFIVNINCGQKDMGDSKEFLAMTLAEDVPDGYRVERVIKYTIKDTNIHGALLILTRNTPLSPDYRPPVSPDVLLDYR